MDSQIYLKDVLKIAVIPKLSNEVCITANFEYKKYIGECKKFTLKARGGAINICFAQGQSGVTYILLPDGVSYNEDVILTKTDFCIFFQSPTINTVLEVILWQ